MRPSLLNLRLQPLVAAILLAALLPAAWLAAETPMPWDRDVLFKAPAQYPAPGFDEPGVRALFFDGMPYQGKPTRVFAWYGAPKVEPGKKLPAMVLIHGGGGTAFAAWVRLWVDRGYAAIAMDTCGAVPKGEYGKWERSPDGGPNGWGGFDQTTQPVTDQWTYQAVADVVLAHSLIRSFPEVDPERIGVTGISWGGYLTCVASGVDNRFRFAAPVYGCGFIHENSTWLDTFNGMAAEQRNAWVSLWEPSLYLERAALPMLWVTGTNDFAYPMDSLQKSYRCAKGPHTLCLRVRMPHGHGGAGENPEEIHAFADHFLKGGPPLVAIAKQGRKESKAWTAYTAPAPIVRAELTFTKAEGKWQDRLWETQPAIVNAKQKKVTATLPEGVTVYYFNLFDAQDRVVSSEHVALDPKSPKGE